MARRHRWSWSAVASYATMAVLTVSVGFPLLWMVISSLKPSADLFTSPPQLFPTGLTLEWYRSVLFTSDAPSFFLNSFEIAMATTVICLSVGTLGAYSLTRFHYPGRDLFLFSALISYVFPAILLFVPIFLILNALDLVDTKLGVITAHVIMTLPLALWMMRSFLLSVPRDLDEAAWVDGAGYFTTLRRIILPLALPGLLSTAIFVFVLSWNEFLFASVIATSSDNKTLPVGIADFVTSFDVRWGEIMALGTLTTVPVIVMFLMVQRYFLRGIMAGAVKG
jgi:ABC-type glycerol-3-phosphate transport system permease component